MAPTPGGPAPPAQYGPYTTALYYSMARGQRPASLAPRRQVAGQWWSAHVLRTRLCPLLPPPTPHTHTNPAALQAASPEPRGPVCAFRGSPAHNCALHFCHRVHCPLPTAHCTLCPRHWALAVPHLFLPLACSCSCPSAVYIYIYICRVANYIYVGWQIVYSVLCFPLL